MTHHNQLIIFDLDDTLVDTSETYWQARTRFVRLLALEGFNPEAVTEHFEEVDTTYIAEYGVVPERYGKSMITTCQQLFAQVNRVPPQSLLQEISSCGNLIMERLPALIEGADELLDWASNHFELALLTRGIDALQQRKIKAAAIEHYFHMTKVVDKKDAAAFREVMSNTGYSASNTWVIGDSVKSDINPGNEAGAKCILYEYSHPEYFWRQEYGTVATGKFYKVHSLRDVAAILNSPQSIPMINGLKNLHP